MWVLEPDTACVGQNSGNTPADHLNALQKVTASDNVHLNNFSQEGYKNFTANLVSGLSDICSGKICNNKSAASLSVSGPASKTLYHWKGFLSEKGAHAWHNCVMHKQL